MLVKINRTDKSRDASFVVNVAMIEYANIYDEDDMTVLKIHRNGNSSTHPFTIREEAEAALDALVRPYTVF